MLERIDEQLAESLFIFYHEDSSHGAIVSPGRSAAKHDLRPLET
jgi:hypothetical protein